MNKVLGISAMALSVLALVVSLVRGGGEKGADPAAPAVAEPRAPRAEGGGMDDGRLAALEDELSRLMKRVDALERSGLPRPGEPTSVMTSEQQVKQLQALRTDVDALLTGEPLGTDEGRKRLKEVVRAVQDEMFSERTQQRQAQQDQERADRLKKFVDEARLSSTQAQDLTRLLDDESARRKALWDARRTAGSEGGGLTGQQVREQMRTLRQTTDDGAKAMLSPEQYTQYESMRSEDRRGPGGGSGAGGGGGGQGGRRERGQ